MQKTKLYNVMFPIWLLWLFPLTWIVILPGNFIIDLLVIVLTLRHLKVEDVKGRARAVIFKVWIMGFVADFIGCFGMFMFNLIDFNSDWIVDNIIIPVNYNPFQTIWGFLWATVCVIITAFFIYVFNYFWCLKKADLSQLERKKIALAMAIFTAPYMFYLPTEWFR